MPDFEVTSPDGRKFIVTAPPGATQDQILAYAKENMPKPQAELPSGAGAAVGSQAVQPKTAKDLLRNFRTPHEILKEMREHPPPDEPPAHMSTGHFFEWPKKSLPLGENSLGVRVGLGLAGAGALKAPEGVGLPKVEAPLGKAGKAIKDLRQEAVGTAAKTAGEETATAAAQEAQGQRVAGTLQRVEAGAPTTEARAQQAQQAPALAAERQRVLADLRERQRVLSKAYQDAGVGVADQQRLVAEAERKIQDTEMGVKALERELLARPTMTADEFGQRVRQITQEINDKYSRIRSAQSGFKQAIEGAGEGPRVNTAPTRALIDQHLKDVRNPSLQRVLGHVRDLTETEGKPALSVRAADSLRGYLDSILQSKQLGEFKIDRETLFVVKQVKRALVEAATQGYAPYRAALAKWRTLSRPLDIVERKGALRPVIDTDPVSSDYALSQAQVVGRVISAARAGNPTLSRLIQESPDLKDASRLYFTHDLFAKEAVPTEASLRTWLKTNETPLRQTGLYDEFRDIRAARGAAAKAVQEAKGARTGSVEQLRAAEAKEKAAADELAKVERLRQKQQQRIADAEKREGRTDYRVLSQRRVEAAKSRLEGQQKTATAEATKRKAIADRYKQFETEIKVARPEEVPAQVRGLVKKLRDDGKMTDSQYEAALKRIQEAEQKIKNRAALVSRLKRIAKYATLGALGYEVGREGVGLVTGR